MSETQEQKTTESPAVQPNLAANFKNYFSSWKIRAGLIGTALVAIFVGFFLLNFFWAHIVAGMGMKSWSERADAAPIECMIEDTNSDGYVSCSAMLRGEVVPLECGSSIFNIGCRVTYGAAAPPVRPTTVPNVRGAS